MSSLLIDAHADQIEQACSNMELLQAHDAGSLMIDVTTSIDGPLLVISGTNGELTLAITSGALSGTARVGNESRTLDAEDARNLTDGIIHTVGLTCNESGLHVFVDGFEAFSATLKAWFNQIEITEVSVDPDRVMTIDRLTVWNEPLSLRNTVARSVKVAPFIQFATSELSKRDARRCGSLATGAMRARFRTRGEGQGGVILSAEGVAGTIRLSINHGSLFYTAQLTDEETITLEAPGRWDDGNWHDVILVCGLGAIDLYVDGYLVIHEAGMVFFADIAPLIRVVVGADLDGTRLFGEASTAMIYDAVLSDFQIKRLSGVDPLDTRALFDTGYQNSVSYRIPSLLTLKSGIVLAGADQRVSIANDSPNDINFCLRRSLDGGKTWEDARTLITYPGSGRLGASVIDSVLVQDQETNRVFVAIDHFPGGVGQPNCVPGTGYTPNGERVLEDRQGNEYILSDDGRVLRDDSETEFVVNSEGDIFAGETYRGNIYLAYDVEPDQPLFTPRTSYLQMIWSDDDGETWSEIRDITASVKEPWMRFFGTSPGNGIQLQSGPHRGRLLIPVYYNHEDGITFSCATIYSDDHGESWIRGESPNDGRIFSGNILSSRNLTDDRASLHESVLVEGEDGSVHAFMRNQHPSGRVAHAISHDGGHSWSEITYVEQLTEIFSQPNAITVQDAKRKGIVFANASQMLPFRGCGILRISFDDGKTWPHNRVLNPRHHVYQCMSQLPDGSIGVLWEREWQGLFFTIVPLTWLTDSHSTIA